MLILKENGVEIDRVYEGGWVRLPNGDMMSPAMDGWQNGPYELVQAPEPPPPSPEEILQEQRGRMRLSFPQLLIGLVAEGWITEAEGRAWLKKTLPAAVEALIAALPAQQQFAATARATDPSYVSRTDPLVIAMATAQGKTEGQIDAFFQTYSNV